MAADFDILVDDPARFELASRLLADGRSVGFGDFELQLHGSVLVVSVLTEKSAVTHCEASAMKAAVWETLVDVFGSVPQMSAFASLSRRFELVASWGKGSTWLGHWVGDEYVPGRRDGDQPAR